MSALDRALEALDDGIQRSSESLGAMRVPSGCWRCGRAPAEGSDLCAGCRAYLLESTDVDPRLEPRRRPPVGGRVVVGQIDTSALPSWARSSPCRSCHQPTAAVGSELCTVCRVRAGDGGEAGEVRISADVARAIEALQAVRWRPDLPEQGGLEGARVAASRAAEPLVGSAYRYWYQYHHAQHHHQVDYAREELAVIATGSVLSRAQLEELAATLGQRITEQLRPLLEGLARAFRDVGHAAMAAGGLQGLAEAFGVEERPGPELHRRRHGAAAVCPQHGPTRGGTCLRCERQRSRRRPR